MVEWRAGGPRAPRSPCAGRRWFWFWFCGVQQEDEQPGCCCNCACTRYGHIWPDPDAPAAQMSCQKGLAYPCVHEATLTEPALLCVSMLVGRPAALPTQLSPEAENVVHKAHCPPPSCRCAENHMCTVVCCELTNLARHSFALNNCSLPWWACCKAH